MAKTMHEWIRDSLLSSRKIFLLVVISISILVAANYSIFGFLPTLTFVLIWSVVFFGTALVTLKILIPKLLINRKKKRYIFYYLFCSMLFMAIVGKICEYIVEELLRDILSVFSNEIDFIKEDENIDGWRYSTWIVSAFLISNVVAFRHKMQEDLRQHEILSAEKKALEMKTLKSQINSHFLHNALNNIYSMIYFGNREDAAKYVLKLSQMLRYVLDDCEAERIPMSKEVTYIKNYIDFQKARFDTNKDIRFNYIQHDSGLTYTPPMIFQPLIENCFKYCPLEKADAFVHIELETDGNRIRFTGENTKNKTEMPDRNNNGIGIKNLDKRLRISYGDNYSLNIFDGADVFRVELTITI